MLFLLNAIQYSSDFLEIISSGCRLEFSLWRGGFPPDSFVSAETVVGTILPFSLI